MPRDTRKKTGIEETFNYKEHFGTANAPQHYISPSGFKLGIWQNSLRARYKKGLVSTHTIDQMNEAGFSWDPRGDRFEKGFQESIRYKQEYGHANAEQDYKTPEGYPLGMWQTHQRQFFKKGLLTNERIMKLSEIGFKWYIGIGKRKSLF